MMASDGPVREHSVSGSFSAAEADEAEHSVASRVVYINDPDRTFASSSSPSPASGNAVRTSKYTLLNFLPRNLFEQFRRAAYLYFLFVDVLNQLPMLTVFAPGISVIPLVVVVLVTLAKDGYEDWRRHRSDKAENARPACVLGPDGRFETKPWRNIRVGEVVRVLGGETLPCDMVLLFTSDPGGLTYVQTANLDGESNLKARYAKHEIQSFFMSRAEEEGGGDGEGISIPGDNVIRSEAPNRNIYRFVGTLDMDGQMFSLGPSNIVLRGCELRNTQWAVCVAVYTGGETKAMLNSSGALSKRSRLETRMNREVILLCVALFTMCSVVGVLHGVWLGNHKKELNDAPFYRKKGHNEEEDYKYYGIGVEVLIAFLKSVIVFQTMIPISLYISMEIVRLGQAYLMIRDRNLYDEATDSRFQCRALNINEDLGQVKYIFSDKTGTLTENKMEFVCASINDIDYSTEQGILADNPIVAAVNGRLVKPKIAVKTNAELVRCLWSGQQTQDNEQAKHATDFFLVLAACNTVVPVIIETTDPALSLVEYQGESPDEQALVYAAAAYGFVLIERSTGHIVIDVLGNKQRYDILGIHEFDSDRKRMSVIVNCPDGAVKLFVKGADSSMLCVSDASPTADMIHMTQTHLQTYSSMGLRTLIIGMRDLSRSDFLEWKSAYKMASTALSRRICAVRKVAVDIECHLRILGASGIEDKLQDGVPEAIKSLRTAGMKLWLLTGDKQETAVSICHACKLLTTEMKKVVININSRESCETRLMQAESALAEVKLMTSSVDMYHGYGEQASISIALIIDGTSLVYILDKEFEEEFFKVAARCDVVLCCRVAPLQKAGIIALVKKRTNDLTLAIGDGANDVSMIQMADVGIGISGQEGRQAVMASDFAMGQFRYLVPLLLVHGHWNYQRMAYMVLYNFYRNSVFVFTLFWYILHTTFTLTVAISDLSSVLYSVIYTALPTIIVGVFDKDLERKILLRYPQLYGAGQSEDRYNLKMFLLTMMDSLWQSLIVFFIPYFAYQHSTIDICSMGDIFILAVVILVNLHLAMDIDRWNCITHIIIWGCIAATAICIIILDSFPSTPGYWVIFHLIETGIFWFCLLAILVVGVVPRFLLKGMTGYFWPSDIQIAREIDKSRESNDGRELECVRH